MCVPWTNPHMKPQKLFIHKVRYSFFFFFFFAYLIACFHCDILIIVWPHTPLLGHVDTNSGKSFFAAKIGRFSSTPCTYYVLWHSLVWQRRKIKINSNKMWSLVAFKAVCIITFWSQSCFLNEFPLYLCSLLVVFCCPVIQKRMLLLTHEVNTYALLFLLAIPHSSSNVKSSFLFCKFSASCITFSHIVKVWHMSF